MIEDSSDVNMILAGDIGGTKTLLGLFESRPGRPRPLLVHTFTTTRFPDLTAMISAFADDPKVRGVGVDAACFGVAGPVLGTTATLTNVPFQIDANQVGRAFQIARVTLLNDLEAMSFAVPCLDDAELHVLQPGTPRPEGNLALIAAGTGFNEALIHNIDGRFVPSPSESGHADWAARNEREILVLRDLIQRFGRVEVERVVSGPGLVNLHRVTHQSRCLAIDDPHALDAPARISTAAMEGRCPGCVEAGSLFVDAYGAEAGNLALRTVATGGLFIGGGIAPKILPLLTDGRFMRAFLDKEPFRAMLTAVPVKVILNAEAGLLGAAVAANRPG
jgi:glucokinase